MRYVNYGCVSYTWPFLHIEQRGACVGRPLLCFSFFFKPIRYLIILLQKQSCIRMTVHFLGLQYALLWIVAAWLQESLIIQKGYLNFLTTPLKINIASSEGTLPWARHSTLSAYKNSTMGLWPPWYTSGSRIPLANLILAAFIPTENLWLLSFL